MVAPPHNPMRSFGRLKSRPIKPRQDALMKALLPKIAVPDPAAGPIDPRDLAPDCTSVTLEIGFGGGEHLAAQAARAPSVLFLGAEPFVNGVASAVRHVDEGGLTNVRIHQGDARELVAVLPRACLETVFILFPDPWPKKRHHKRRLIQSEFLDQLGRVVAPRGRVRFATDWADYADQALARFIASPHFEWTAQRADDWRTPPADHITTRYEQKALGDCAPVYFDFIRP